MNIWKKFYLVILSLVIFSQFLLAGERHTGALSLRSGFSDSKQAAFLLPEALTGQRLATTAGEVAFQRNNGEEAELCKTFVKYRKKFKRVYTSSVRLKPPVKDLDPLTVNIFTKESYSKPFFLSHLHHFLFRLTPF